MTILNNAGSNLPSMEEMIAALSSPVVPKGTAGKKEISHEDQMTTDQMIREMFSMMRQGHDPESRISANQRPRDSSYNSSTDTYNGLPATSTYNGVSF